MTELNLKNESPNDAKPVLCEVLSAEDCLELGFERLPHFTVADNLIYQLGRNRHLSIGCVGTPNEMLFICESDPKDYRKINDLICLHNYDYDGYLSKSKLQTLISSIGVSKHLAQHRILKVTNGRVMVNGKDVTPGSATEIQIQVNGKDVTPGSATEIQIQVNGDLAELEVDFASSIEVNGSVGKIRSGSGDITCANITGGAQTGSGDIDCDSIVGDVQTGSGDVNVMGNVTGSVRTGSGDIKYRKS